VGGAIGRVLVLGSGGFLGSNVARSCADDASAEVVLHVRDRRTQHPAGTARTVHADLTRPHELEKLLAEVQPEFVVNCAALADVDACERDPVLADALNHQLPARLAAWTAASGALLAHVSTDAVFDGRGGPYREHDDPSPINEYGRSKLAGERAVAVSDARALIARTNIVGWSPTGTRSLLEYFHGRLSRGERAPGFVDIHFRPLPVQWFWPACARLLAAGASGLVHVTGPELLSKYDFGRRIAVAFDLDPDLVEPTEGLTGSVRAARPPRLDVIPSRLVSGPLLFGDLDRGLEELRRMRCVTEPGVGA
jgi:dTDP-4-dehydrorhamnose reductase